MSAGLEFAIRAVFIGVGATLILDLWAASLKRFRGIPSVNWAMVGRWLGHFRHGRFMHDNIAAAPRVRGERVIGWGAHYAIGILFAVLLLAIWGLDWARHPTLLPALIVGLLTLAGPFFVMQPGMGAGIAASRTPNPTQARIRSIIAHTVFGIGLYVTAMLSAQLIRP